MSFLPMIAPIVALTIFGNTSLTYAKSDEIKELYFQNCALCHAEDGAGSMPGIPDISGPSGALWKPVKTLFDTISQGVERDDLPTSMPPKGGNENLTDKQIFELIKFMRLEFGK